jgi:hypothetical protein
MMKRSGRHCEIEVPAGYSYLDLAIGELTAPSSGRSSSVQAAGQGDLAIADRHVGSADVALQETNSMNGKFE